MSKIKKGVSVVTPEKEPEDAQDNSPELMAATSEPSDPSGAATNNALSTSRASSVSSRRGKMTPLKILHSGHASEYDEDDEDGGIDDLTHSQRRRRAHISMDTVDPEHTYVERIKSPRRAADGCETLEEFDSEKRAHIADDTIDPERTYVEKLKSPRRAADGCSTLEEFDSEKRAHLADDIIDPEHTYVERLKSPCRAADGSSFEEYISEKHAHIDVAAASPHGFVHRPPTPKHSSLTPQLQPISGFTVESTEQNNNTTTSNNNNTDININNVAAPTSSTARVE